MPAGERLLVPVEDGPVHEEQPLFGSSPGGRLAEVRDLALSRGCERVALGDVRVPEDVVLDERAPGTEHDDDVRIFARTGTRKIREEVRERSLEDAGEHGIAGKLGFGRAPQDFLPRGERLAHIDRSGRQSGATKGSSDVVRDATPGKRG